MPSSLSFDDTIHGLHDLRRRVGGKLGEIGPNHIQYGGLVGKGLPDNSAVLIDTKVAGEILDEYARDVRAGKPAHEVVNTLLQKFADGFRSGGVPLPEQEMAAMHAAIAAATAKLTSPAVKASEPVVETSPLPTAREVSKPVAVATESVTITKEAEAASAVSVKEAQNIAYEQILLLEHKARFPDKAYNDALVSLKNRVAQLLQKKDLFGTAEEAYTATMAGYYATDGKICAELKMFSDNEIQVLAEARLTKLTEVLKTISQKVTQKLHPDQRFWNQLAEKVGKEGFKTIKKEGGKKEFLPVRGLGLPENPEAYIEGNVIAKENGDGKGLLIATAAVALCAIIYGATKLFGQKPANKAKSWVEKSAAAEQAPQPQQASI